jgi:hypothetical protein
MGERTARRHRVIIEDARRNGHYLRVTWHQESRQFVVSTWRDDVCTGAAQLSAADGAELAALLVDGLADAASAPPPAAADARRSGGGRAVADLAAAAVERLRAWWRRAATPPTPLPPPASGPPADAPTRTRRSA